MSTHTVDSVKSAFSSFKLISAVLALDLLIYQHTVLYYTILYQHTILLSINEPLQGTTNAALVPVIKYIVIALPVSFFVSFEVKTKIAACHVSKKPESVKCSVLKTFPWWKTY